MNFFKKNKKSFWRFQGNELNYLEEVLREGFRAGADGSFTTRLEKLFSEIYKVNYAIAANSGTTTLHSALLAFGCQQGDEVLTPALTPLMCGLAPHYTNATPVFVDSNEDTFLMDPDDIERKITANTKAIIVTHMYGGVCDMERIMNIANEKNIYVLEDCAQCHMGRTPDGKLAGTHGDAGSWSFENSKQLTCGDGGILTCDDEELATKIRKIAGLGFKTLSATSGRVRTDRDKLQNPEWTRFDSIGYNYRMNQLAAAVALAQVERTDFFIKLRQAIGEGFRSLLRKSELLIPQYKPKGYEYTYYTFSARFEGEKFGISWFDFRKKFMENGGDGIYAASQILPEEPAFKENKIGRGEVPKAYNLQKKLMNFTTNQENEEKRNKQLRALEKTLNFFGDSSN